MIIFLNLKEANNYIDRGMIFNIIRETGVVIRVLAVIEQILSTTKSEIKFCGEISEPFIISGIKQGDNLLQYFSIVSEKREFKL